MHAERPRTKAGQREETVRNLIQIARRHFSEVGYAQASTEAIVRESGLTRGALYHHFANKEGLFEAVVATVQREVAHRIETASQIEAAPWEQLLAGCRAFLEACTEQDIQRILLIDGPAVIGWEAWRKLDADHSARLLEGALHELVDGGLMRVASVPAATHLLSGAMNEAVLWIARSPQPEEALKATLQVLEQLLAGLRARPV